jgi:hypothetical protein
VPHQYGWDFSGRHPCPTNTLPVPDLSITDIHAQPRLHDSARSILCFLGSTVASKDGVESKPILVETARPDTVAQFFDGMNTIDVQNHLPQGLLKLEEHWKTQTRQHRLIATILGIYAADAFLTRAYLRRSTGEKVTISSTLGAL